MNSSRRLVCAAALAAAVTWLSGCATLPSPEAMKAEVANFELPKLPAPGQAIVYVVRPSSVGGLIRFNVFLNDQEAPSEMGFNRGSQYIYFNVKPGEHKLFSKAENWAETQFTAKAGDIIFVQQEAAIGVIMARNNLLRLEDLPGRYHVKTLQLGTILKTDK